MNDVVGTDTLYYYDGVNEVFETSYTGSGEDAARWYVHGVSYIDERLMMMNLYTAGSSTDDRPYYYTLDRMYNVRSIVDRAGVIIERYAYDPYGRPLIRESGGRGDMWDFGTITDAGDRARLLAETGTIIWDVRAGVGGDTTFALRSYHRDPSVSTHWATHRQGKAGAPAQMEQKRKKRAYSFLE